MVDVGEARTKRIARAQARVISPGNLPPRAGRRHEEGDVLAVAQVAASWRRRRRSELIPMCHPIAITSADISFELDAGGTITISAEVGCTGETGVEMEALTASVAALTVYDMCKAVQRTSA
ncbi:MAG: cyclic pyranopterin monophosphate synthase MoaC [Oscillospiraceae bacterium]